MNKQYFLKLKFETLKFENWQGHFARLEQLLMNLLYLLNLSLHSAAYCDCFISFLHLFPFTFIWNSILFLKFCGTFLRNMSKLTKRFWECSIFTVFLDEDDTSHFQVFTCNDWDAYHRKSNCGQTCLFA